MLCSVGCTTAECVYIICMCTHAHLVRACIHMGSGERRVVDELPSTVKVCTLSSPSASKKNGAFTSFLNSLAPLKDKWQKLPPPPASPPLCGRQVAALLAFAIGRHTQRGWVRKGFTPPLLDILPGPPTLTLQSRCPRLCLLPPSPAQHQDKQKRKKGEIKAEENQ